MVQVLAFVMMMLAMAVFVLSQSVSKQAVEMIAKAVKADVKPDANVKELTKAVMDQLERIQQPEAAKAAESAAAPAAGTVAPTEEGSEKIVGLRFNGARTRTNQALAQPPVDAPQLTIGFEEKSFKIEQDRVQALAKFAGDNKVAEGGQGILIKAHAYSGDGALSEARRLAYYRAMVARKHLIDAKVRADSIRINVTDTADKQSGATVEVIVVAAGGSR